MKTKLVVIISILIFSHFIKAEKLPVEAFGSLPLVDQLRLSPDGKHISYLREYKGQTLVAVTKLENRNTVYVARTDNIEFKVGWVRWANNKTLLMSVAYPEHEMAVKFTETRLMRVAIDGKSKMESVVMARRKELVPQFQNRIVDMLPDEPNAILMALDLRIKNTPGVYKVNFDTNWSRELVHRQKTHIKNWLTDRQHRVRIGFGRDKTRIFYRLLDYKTDNWRNIWEYEIFSVPDITPLGFGLDPNELYIRADHEGKYAIFKVDVSDPELPQTLVFADPNYDVEGRLIYSKKNNDVIGVYHGEADDAKVYFDPEYQAFQKALNKALPDSYNNIYSFSGDENKYILYTSSLKSPGSYYLGDKVTNRLDFVMDQYPLLSNRELLGKEKITYKARDGVEIEAYVTLPHKEVQDTQAAIVIPHGGPMSRNYGGFDWFSEFFASRGYTVIEPNFRGSSGYGFEFEMASVQKWGGAMQDDLADAANWLTENYPIKKGQVCMVGASYGGYAAMMAAAKQQEIFKCAVSIAGISDLEYLIIKARRFNNYKVVKKQIGSDTDSLEENSPITYVEKIKMPLLMIHGENDRVVDVEHSRRMYDELKDYNSEAQFFELPAGNHYLEIEANRIKTLQEAESFLERYLNSSR